MRLGVCAAPARCGGDFERRACAARWGGVWEARQRFVWRQMFEPEPQMCLRQKSEDVGRLYKALRGMGYCSWGLGHLFVG